MKTLIIILLWNNSDTIPKPSIITLSHPFTITVNPKTTTNKISLIRVAKDETVTLTSNKKFIAIRDTFIKPSTFVRISKDTLTKPIPTSKKPIIKKNKGKGTIIKKDI